MRALVLTASLGLAFAGLFVGGVAADETEDIINQASVEEYHSYLRVLTGVDAVPGTDPPFYLTNRYSFYDEIHVAAQWIYDHFGALGLDTSFHEFDPAYGPNVIGELYGSTRPEDIYIICGHFDTYHAGDQHNAPGCDDNASGTCTAMMAARILSQYEFEGTIRFIAWAGEEQWMVGSLAYVAEAWAAGENIVAAINLDMILHPGFDNYDPDPDYDLDIEGNNPSQWLAQYLADRYGTYTPIDFEVHNNENYVSDHWSFWQYGYDAVGLCENTAYEIWGGSNDSYHQTTDTIDNPHFDWDFPLHTIRGGMAGLIDLAGLIPSECPGDLDGDGDTDQSDLGILLADWGCDDPVNGCAGDLDGDDKTDQVDLGILLADWGCGTGP